MHHHVIFLHNVLHSIRSLCRSFSWFNFYKSFIFGINVFWSIEFSFVFTFLNTFGHAHVKTFGSICSTIHPFFFIQIGVKSAQNTSKLTKFPHHTLNSNVDPNIFHFFIICLLNKWFSNWVLHDYLYFNLPRSLSREHEFAYMIGKENNGNSN